MVDNETPNKAKLFSKMAKVMGGLTTIGTDKKHGQGWAYASATQVFDAIRKLLAENNLVIWLDPIEVQEVGNGYRVTYTATMACGDTGVTIERKWIHEGASRGDKALTGVHTNAHKYFLMDTFVVSSGDAPDSDENDEPKQQRRQVKQSQQQGTQQKQKKSQEPSKRDLAWDIIEHNGYFDSRVAFDKYVMELLKDGSITKDDSLTRIIEVITYKMNQADEIADEKQDAVQEKLQEAYGKLTDEFESLDALKQWLGIQGIVISRLSAVDTIVGMIRERIAEQAKLAS